MWDNYNLGWLDSEAERQGGSSYRRLRGLSLSQKPAPPAPPPLEGLDQWSHLACRPSDLPASSCFACCSDMLAVYLLNAYTNVCIRAWGMQMGQRADQHGLE